MVLWKASGGQSFKASALQGTCKLTSIRNWDLLSDALDAGPKHLLSGLTGQQGGLRSPLFFSSSSTVFSYR